MKLPRNLSGAQLIKALDQISYQPTRQTGSYVRLTSHVCKEHRLTILHGPLKVGTLAAILANVAAHHGTTREALISGLFGN